MKLDKVNDAAALTSKGKAGAIPPKKDKVEQDPKDGFSTQLSLNYTMPSPGQWGPVQLNGQVVPVLPQPGPKEDPSTTDDDDGPAVGGGYEPSSVEVNLPVPTGDGLLWRTSGMPKQTKITGDDGPGVGGGYFTRPFKATNTGSLFEEFIPPEPPTGQKLLPAPNQAEAKTEKTTAAAPGQEVAPAEGPSAFQGPTVLESWQAKFSQDPVAAQRLELKSVEFYEKQFANIKTPAQFKAQTDKFKDMLKDGMTLEELRPQAYALARLSAQETLGKKPYDSQMLGALSMDAGTIAQMGTGEGKTLTALMPLYLNSLAGKGSHLVTVNDYLAQAGFDELKPALEKLGVSAGLVLKDMPADQKRAGYNADVTYLSNDTLGFDYLGDRTVTNPNDRVQRQPYFALLDEADQVLLDEARVPLIIAGLQGDEEVKPAVEQGTLFNNLVKDLVPGEDFRIDRKMHSAFLTDVGQDIVANEVGLLELKKDDPDYQAKLAAGKELRTLLREEAKITQGETELPRELVTQRGLKAAWCHLLGRPTETTESKHLEELRARKDELLDIFPGANLYAEDQMERVRYLQNALEARGLFRLGKDYAVTLSAKEQNELAPVLSDLNMAISENNIAKLLVAKEILATPTPGESYFSQLRRQLGVVATAVDPRELTNLLTQASPNGLPGVPAYLDGMIAQAAQQKGVAPAALLQEALNRHSEVQIIDEFKGRISEGRRFTQGLHQALEIKEGLEPKPETYTVASITYPNLFRRYERVAGMTGTAESSKKEFSEVLGLNVVNVPPNKERKRVDHADKVFVDQASKYAAVTEQVREYFQEGVPVLVATRSVEMNQYVSALLSSEGIPNQALDAQDVKTNTPEENAIIATAGQSGVITVATNMAGRGVDIKPDAVNYKKLAVACDTACREGKSVVVQLDPKQPEQVDRLTSWFNLPEDDADKIKFSQAGKPEKGKVLLTFEPVTGGDTVLKAEDFPGKKLIVLATERNLDQRIDDQLRGRAGRQGAPGETQFYVSLEDDLMRIYGDEDREKLKKLLDKSNGQDKIRALADEAQERVQNMNADARLQTAKFDQVANKQREVVWGFRDKWVDSRPGQPVTDGSMDIGATVHDWVVDAYTMAVGEAMKEQKGNSEARLQGAIAQVAQDFKFPVSVPEGKGDWKKRLDSALRTQLGKVEESINTNRPSDLHKDFLETYQWQTALQNLDKGWTNQLQVLEDEKQGSNLEAYAGREPEQAYIERAFKAFDEMWNYVKGETTKTLLQQMTEVDDLLKQRKA